MILFLNQYIIRKIDLIFDSNSNIKRFDSNSNIKRFDLIRFENILKDSIRFDRKRMIRTPLISNYI